MRAKRSSRHVALGRGEVRFADALLKGWNRVVLNAFLNMLAAKANEAGCGLVFLKCAQRELTCAQADWLANVPSLRHLQEDAVGASPAAGCGWNPPSDLGAGTARCGGSLHHSRVAA